MLLLLLFSCYVQLFVTHGLQDSRLPCLPLSPGVCSSSCPLSHWCYLTISSSATLFFVCLQSVPTSGSFPMSWQSAKENMSDIFFLSCKIYLKWKSCLTCWDLMDYTGHGILQARILEWVAFPFSRGSSQPRDQTQVSRIAGRFFTSWASREAQEYT